MSAKRKQLYTRFLVLLSLVVCLNIGIYVTVVVVIRTKAANIQAASARLTTILPQIVQRLAIAPIESIQWYTLIPDTSLEYAPQQVGVADSWGEPMQPTEVAVIDTKLGESVVIAWQAVLGQTYDGVEIYRSTKEKAKVSDMELVYTSTTFTGPTLAGQWVDRTVQNDTTYYYALRAYRMQSEKLASDFTDLYSVIPTDQTPPAPPKWVKVTSYHTNAESGLSIEWERAFSNDVSDYRIYRSTQRGQLGELIQTVTPDITLVKDGTVTPGVEYYYAVIARDAVGNASTDHLGTSSFGNTSPFVTGDDQANVQINGN